MSKWLQSQGNANYHDFINVNCSSRHANPLASPLSCHSPFLFLYPDLPDAHNDMLRIELCSAEAIAESARTTLKRAVTKAMDGSVIVQVSQVAPIPQRKVPMDRVTPE